MPHTQDDFKAARIDQVISHMRERLSGDKADQLDRFVRIVFARAATEDIADLTTETLYGTVMGLWEFAKNIEPGKPRIRVFNPRLEEHGFESGHTVIEIVNDNMPFLFDSITMELSTRSRSVHLAIHPVLRLLRDDKGRLLSLVDGDGDGDGDGNGDGDGGEKDDSRLESLMHIEIDEITDRKVHKEIADRISFILEQVSLAVTDWKPCLGRLEETIDTLIKNPPPVPREEVEESVKFLRWLGENHFTFLGCRDYDLQPDSESEPLRIVPGSGLGILRNPDYHILAGRKGMASTSEEVRQFLREPQPIIITKANRRSAVHRPVHMDYIGVKRFDREGRMIGESRFVGLFTSVSYNRSPMEIPLLRQKLQKVLDRSGAAPSSHDGKALFNILETYPRDELFQISEDLLLEISRGILHLEERPRPSVFVRPDRFERFVSALVFLPREVYDTSLRERIEEILCRAYDGSISARYTQVGNSTLARLHLIVKTKPGKRPAPNLRDLQDQVALAARSWDDLLREALVKRWGEEAGNQYWSRFQGAFSAAYKEKASADLALLDIEKIETLTDDTKIAVNLYRADEDAEQAIRFKIYHADGPVALSDCLPMLESMGLKVMEEHPSTVAGTGQRGHAWIHDFRMIDPSGQAVDLDLIKEMFEAAFLKIWDDQIENDRFNLLVLRAGLSWRQILVLRALAKYLRQIGSTYSQAYMEDTLAAQPRIARDLFALFAARFETAGEKDSAKGAKAAKAAKMERAARDETSARITVGIEKKLEAVSSLDEDRILRCFLNLIQSTLRTNYYQLDSEGENKPYVSFKLDSSRIDDLPLPRPMVEIFVYSPRVEGIHLRGGPVARGGIRWSDRREDFRTEILGLMKAQNVKNVVIVPSGAKGGFVPKHLPQGGTREEFIAEGVACYKTLMRGLLDITDNLIEGSVVPPRSVVRYDGDDPYLVVAADKGTATFSDIANGISLEYGHWLGDAFASGGSVGYDHKKMGITARGAWESVARHFRETGLDVQATPFTVVGVGDMSGDVFGNGMLRSTQIKLLAAFDHRHVFIDPDPDTAVSFKERERLFGLERSSWADYDAALISAGGGVFPRTAKSIDVSPEMKTLLGLKPDHVTPMVLMNAVLKAKVDLLWIGGIGTYVKSKAESNTDVGDRANDSLRVNGAELRCQVVGEGGNLGFTQRGRIEYATGGGRINTDAVDNSGGVDCSDREVNIKILLDAVVRTGHLTQKQRDKLLGEMTDDVSELVLDDNYRQTEAITAIEARAPYLLTSHTRFMRALEKSGRLNREVEYLPNDEEIADRAADRKGLTRPEISVLLAYGKMTLYDALLGSDLPEDAYLNDDVVRSFPRQLGKKYRTEIERHPLRREITATMLANGFINRLGPAYWHDLSIEEGWPVGEVGRAYVIVRDVFDLRTTWTEVGQLDNKIEASVQTEMITEIATLQRRECLWFLNNLPAPLDIGQAVAAYLPGVAELRQNLQPVLSRFEEKNLRERTSRLVKKGVPTDLAGRVASMEILASGCDIARAANESGRSVQDVARIYFGLGAHLGLDWLRAAAEKLAMEDHWDRLATKAIIEDFYGQQRTLTAAALRLSNGAQGKDAVKNWAAGKKHHVERTRSLIAEIKASGITVSKLTFANRQIRRLISN